MDRGGSILRIDSYHSRIRKVVAQKGGHTSTRDRKKARTLHEVSVREKQERPFPR